MIYNNMLKVKRFFFVVRPVSILNHTIDTALIQKNFIGTIFTTISINKKSPYLSFKYSNKNMQIRLLNLYYISITPQTQIFLPILFSFLKVPPNRVQKLRNLMRYIKFALCLQTSYSTF